MKPTRRRGSILVVDDDAVLRDMLGKILQKEGYHVRKAKDGEQAVQEFIRQRADAVLLDICMPRMDGIEALRHIREADPTASVVMLTGFGTLRTAREAMELGAVDYVTKPFDNEFVISVVHSALKKREAAWPEVT